ncbi:MULTISPECIES: HlyD family secretion protein [unclassified Rhizobium]|uniref:HlyD family secretion protein n=1 Tax=unclassified Rhizobium TaxID=2613769 RepID=UPI00068B689F|nr:MULTISPECIES: HlyD family secretion protein [unclassified Rhizobium]MBN8953577.1 HlyD family secretion protein [Rhizobium tropici]OJY79028.1 MAG: hypothetical protein BGP09_24330 [Rhizobium sp. 60-20]RKD67757.1 membrane fusion protein (multidrug efflux system) [Rhizobium sp. WW_1]
MTKLKLASPTAPRSTMEFPAPKADPAVGNTLPAAAIAPSKRRRMSAWVGGVAAVILLAGAYIYMPALYIRQTNDASVQADTVAVVPKVAGYVTALHVDDNSVFAKNDLLVEIDPRDFEVALKSAQAGLLSAQASKENVNAQLAQQQHQIAAAQATVQSDEAQLQYAQQQLARNSDLATHGAGSEQLWQQAQADIGQRKALVEHDRAALAAAQSQINVLQSQIDQADAAITGAQAAVAQAQLNLSYTKIYAADAGSVANKTVQVGSFVQPGQTLFSDVPRQMYIVANFKETELSGMRQGQPVRIRVDALPGQILEGHLDSIQRGTGSSFALLPPENATGNYVKVVQRIPVKIMLDGPQQTLDMLSPGMSVEPTVTIATPPKWLGAILSAIGMPST